MTPNHNEQDAASIARDYANQFGGRTFSSYEGAQESLVRTIIEAAAKINALRLGDGKDTITQALALMDDHKDHSAYKLLCAARDRAGLRADPQ